MVESVGGHTRIFHLFDFHHLPLLRNPKIPRLAPIENRIFGSFVWRMTTTQARALPRAAEVWRCDDLRCAARRGWWSRMPVSLMDCIKNEVQMNAILEGRCALMI